LPLGVLILPKSWGYVKKRKETKRRGKGRKGKERNITH
jgi:hypothetical protein